MWLKAPEKCQSAGFNGQVFEVNENGLMEVPEEATTLLSHGFTIASDAEIKKGASAKAAPAITAEEAPAKGK